MVGRFQRRNTEECKALTQWFMVTIDVLTGRRRQIIHALKPGWLCIGRSTETVVNRSVMRSPAFDPVFSGCVEQVAAMAFSYASNGAMKEQLIWVKLTSSTNERMPFFRQ